MKYSDGVLPNVIHPIQKKHMFAKGKLSGRESPSLFDLVAGSAYMRLQSILVARK